MDYDQSRGVFSYFVQSVGLMRQGCADTEILNPRLSTDSDQRSTSVSTNDVTSNICYTVLQFVGNKPSKPTWYLLLKK